MVRIAGSGSSTARSLRSDYQVLPEANLLVFRPDGTMFGEMERFMEEKRSWGTGTRCWIFTLRSGHFLNVYDRLDDNYRIYARLGPDGTSRLRLLCIDPSRQLKECLDRGKDRVLFRDPAASPVL